MIANGGFGPRSVGLRSVGEDDLQAYVDGLLDARRRSDVEAYLAAHPEEIERVEAYRLQNIGLHALCDRPLAEPVSAPIDRLRRDLHASVTRQRVFRRAVASLALVVGISAVGWWGLGFEAPSRDPAPAIAQRAGEVSQREPRDPPRAEAAAGVTQASLVGWLSQRASGKRPDWPDLQPFGLTLRGERMAAAAGGLAVVLTYEDTNGRPLALHIDLNGDDLPIAAPPAVREREVALYWRAGRLVLGVIGAMERREVLRIAEAVTAQIAAVQPDHGTPGADELLSAQSEPTAEPITQAADSRAQESDAEAVPESVPEKTEAVAPPDRSPATEPPPAEGDQDARTESDAKPVSILAPRRLQRASHHRVVAPSGAVGGAVRV